MSVLMYVYACIYVYMYVCMYERVGMSVWYILGIAVGIAILIVAGGFHFMIHRSDNDALYGNEILVLLYRFLPNATVHIPT